MNISRRALLSTTALAPIALTVACTPQVSNILSDASVIANGLAGVLPAIETVVGVGTAVATKVNAIVSDIQTAAAALSTAVGSGATSLAQRVTAGVSALMPLLANFKLPSWVVAVLQAAQTLAPVVLQVVGMVALAPDPRAVAQARAVLMAAAK